MLADLSRFARRLIPARPDLAARHLQGRVDAARYVEGVPRAVSAPLLDLTLVPDPRAERATQVLHGEAFTVYEERDGLAWGQAGDGYVGWVAAAGLGAPQAAGQAVTALSAHVYPAPDIRARPLMALPLLARVAVAGEEGAFARLAAGGYLARAHLAPVAGDFVAQAERFLGAPYLWGGRSAAGLDCSALLQLALMAVGMAAPRDSDMQAALLGAALDAGEDLRRGDLVFWTGHAGVIGDDGMLIHANAWHMACVREPFAEAAARIVAAGGGPVTARRRLAPGREGWRPPV